jgi:hypothetical protein
MVFELLTRREKNDSFKNTENTKKSETKNEKAKNEKSHFLVNFIFTKKDNKEIYRLL